VTNFITGGYTRGRNWGCHYVITCNGEYDLAGCNPAFIAAFAGILSDSLTVYL
jgi:hypothetical protein